ncbi:peptidoglycan-binding protein [Oculatella sp. LEGE 06141]|nr:peptidoglycan-binding protein [Oculatella sp. LEGE 06141]
MQGPAVSRLQERLQATGFFDGAIDGIFGPQTQAAVRAAQRNFQLDPDGVVGPATWTALLR